MTALSLNPRSWVRIGIDEIIEIAHPITQMLFLVSLKAVCVLLLFAWLTDGFNVCNGGFDRAVVEQAAPAQLPYNY